MQVPQTVMRSDLPRGVNSRWRQVPRRSGQLTLNGLGACPASSVRVHPNPATSASDDTSGRVVSVCIRRRPPASQRNCPHFCPLWIVRLNCWRLIPPEALPLEQRDLSLHKCEGFISSPSRGRKQ